MSVPAPASTASSAAVTVPAVTTPAAAKLKAKASVKAEEGVRWQKLKPSQREALKPLQSDWAGLDAERKQKWLQLADRMPKMPEPARARVQERMADWAKLTPTERGQARLRFEEAKQTPLPDRRSRWEAYQALSAEEKRALAARAAAERGQNAADNDAHRNRWPGGRADRGDRSGREASHSKSNIVPNPAFAAPPRPVGATFMQAAPGATTTSISRRAAPPMHQQTGLPKIAATPEFVDKATLLPQRGAQSATLRAAPPSSPAASASPR